MDDVGDDIRVTTERDGHVLVVTMARTGKRNAVDGAMTAALDGALNLLDDDPDLWCGILTGGPTVFCAGTDLAEGSGTPTERGGIYGVVGRTRKTPLIAAVEGVAFGGGFEIAMTADLVVAGRSARFGLPEVKRGLVPTSGALFRAARGLPLAVAKQLVLTGDEIGPAELHRLGFVNEVVDDGEALESARRWAERITANSPLAVGASLRALDQVVSADDDLGWAATDEARRTIIGSDDAAEGVAAFFEKRTPNWTGR